MRVLVIGAGASIEEAKRANALEEFWSAHEGHCLTDTRSSTDFPRAIHSQMQSQKNDFGNSPVVNQEKPFL